MSGRAPAATIEVEAYLEEVRRRVAEVLDVVGVYVGGSVALDGYQSGQSDLDVAVVTPGALLSPVKDACVTRLRHEALPCPARGLELVVYSAADAASADVAAAFQLNLNTGTGLRFRVDFEPQPGEGHWFAIDRAILREHGVVLDGAPTRDVFGEIPRRYLLSVVAEALRWFDDNEAAKADTVLNACRALRYASTGEWSSKPSAGRWALDRVADPGVVRAALAARRGARGPGREETRRLVAAVLDQIDGIQSAEWPTLVPR